LLRGRGRRFNRGGKTAIAGLAAEPYGFADAEHAL